VPQADGSGDGMRDYVIAFAVVGAIAVAAIVVLLIVKLLVYIFIAICVLAVVGAAAVGAIYLCHNVAVNYRTGSYGDGVLY
jgi:hypothetical protein